MINRIFVFILLAIIGFGFTTKLKEKSDEVKFLRQVESAIKAHDADKLMEFMDPEYKRIQHDEFLAGNTTQFLNEFFCSEIPFLQITDATLLDCLLIKGTKNEYTVTFEIKGNEITISCSFFMIKNMNTGEFTIYSAVG